MLRELSITTSQQ